MTFERNKTNRRVVSDLKSRSTFGIIFYILVSLIVVFAANLHKTHLYLSVFFLLSIAGICLFRLIHLAISKNMGERHETLNKYIFFASVIITSLIWGVTFALIMLLVKDNIPQMLMTVCICGLCAGGVVAFIPNMWLSIIFNISMLIPAVIIMLANGTNIPLSIMIILFSVYMGLIAYRGNGEYWNALRTIPDAGATRCREQLSGNLPASGAPDPTGSLCGCSSDAGPRRPPLQLLVEQAGQPTSAPLPGAA